jgi:hypothetical protein
MSGIMNMFVAAKTTVAAAVDAFFNLTTLLLNTSSTNGAQNNTFLDSSTNNFTITRNGNTTQGTFTPFSQTGWSNYQGAVDTSYLNFTTSPGTLFQFAGDFTVESWVNLAATSTGSSIWVTNDGSASYFALNLASTNFEIFLNGTGPASSTIAHGLVVGQWSHVAMVRSGSTITLYTNGVSKGTISNSSTLGYANPTLNRNGGGSVGTSWYLSNLRIVKSAVYTSAFTPPTTPLTNIANTSLLTCQSNRFVDNSSNALVATVTGTPSVQAFSPFLPTAAYDTAVVGGSGYFDGTGDYLSVASNTAFDIMGGSYTIEYWFYPISVSTAIMVDRQDTSSPFLGYSCRLINSTAQTAELNWNPGFTGALTTTTAPIKINQWNHIAYTCDGTTLRIYANGNLEASTTTLSSSNYSGALTIGSRAASQPTNAYFSGFILRKGTASYTGSTYTIPTTPPTAITNTQLLLNYTNSGIFDSTAKNVLETVGNAQVSTTQAKWGTTSMAFDGNGDYLSIPNTSLLQLGSSDWTIECWAYISSTTGDQRPISQNNSNYEFAFFMSSGGAMSAASYQSGGSTNFNISMGTLSAGQWYHLAASRSGSTVRAFVNGTLQNSATYSGTIDARTGGWRLGASYVPGDYFNGYLDDVRITLGYARYTATFTPATAAFPLQ